MTKSTDARTLKNLSKPTRYSIPDTRGLHLWVRRDGKKYWIYRYTFAGVRHDLGLGPFPIISLRDARKKATSLRREIYIGIDPIEEKRSNRQEASRKNKSMKFEDFAYEMIEKISPQWSSVTHKNAWHRSLEIYAYPVIGRMPIANIRTAHILQILEPIWEKFNVSAVRLRGRLEKILSAAITTGVHQGPNPATWKNHLENILPRIKKNVTHHSAIPYKLVPDLISRIRKSKSITALALEFTILNATRAQETIRCSRDEIDGDLWTIPAARMKARKEHQIPLTSRSLQIIETAKSMDPESRYVFSINGKPLTHTGMRQFAKYYFDETATVHGFRSSFRDWVAEETTHSSEVAEMALAQRVSGILCIRGEC